MCRNFVRQKRLRHQAEPRPIHNSNSSPEVRSVELHAAGVSFACHMYEAEATAQFNLCEDP